MVVSLVVLFDHSIKERFDERDKIIRERGPTALTRQAARECPCISIRWAAKGPLPIRDQRFLDSHDSIQIGNETEVRDGRNVRVCWAALSLDIVEQSCVNLYQWRDLNEGTVCTATHDVARLGENYETFHII